MLVTNGLLVLLVTGFLMVTFMVVRAVGAATARRKLNASGQGPRVASKPVLTANEIEFYFRLTRALPNHIILSQVAMGALLMPDISETDSRTEFFRIRSQFAQKIVDYVVCDRSLRVVAIVELDDHTHNAAKDAKRDAMLKSAGYKTLRFDSRNKPTERQIARSF